MKVQALTSKCCIS